MIGFLLNAADKVARNIDPPQRAYTDDVRAHVRRKLDPDAQARIARGVEQLRGVFPDHDGVTCYCGLGNRPCKCNRGPRLSPAGWFWLCYFVALFASAVTIAWLLLA